MKTAMAKKHVKLNCSRLKFKLIKSKIKGHHFDSKCSTTIHDVIKDFFLHLILTCNFRNEVVDNRNSNRKGS